MPRICPVPERRIASEFLDDPLAAAREVRTNLGEIRRLNAWFGASRPLKMHLADLLSGRHTARVLDVATGSADLPLSVFRWGERQGIRLHIVASDASPLVLDEAETFLKGRPIELARADARSLSWPDSSFDIVLCSLALHHFDGLDAVKVLQEMWRVCRLGIVVVDLYRSFLAYGATWLATHALCRNPMTRADGPLSVLRAYRPDEVALLSRLAGIPCARTRLHPFFRQSLVARKSISHG